MTTAETLLRVAREGLLLAVIVSAPAVLAALLVGLVVGLLQATTQIQEGSISFAPKLIAVVVSLLVAGPWIGVQLTRFFAAVLDVVPRVT